MLALAEMERLPTFDELVDGVMTWQSASGIPTTAALSTFATHTHTCPKQTEAPNLDAIAILRLELSSDKQGKREAWAGVSADSNHQRFIIDPLLLTETAVGQEHN